MSNIKNKNLVNLTIERIEDFSDYLLNVCKDVYFGKKEPINDDYIDKEWETEMAEWLLYEVLRSKPMVDERREYISQDKFVEDFYKFNRLICNIIPQGNEEKQLKALCMQNDNIYNKDKQKKNKPIFLLGKVRRFYDCYVDETMRMDKETELLYMVIFSVWLYKIEDAEQRHDELSAEDLLEELKEMHIDLCSFRKKSIENGKNNFLILPTLVWTVRCCAKLYFLDENEFIITRYGVQLFLERFRFTESIVKAELLGTLVAEWKQTEQILNTADPGSLILRLNQFMEGQGTPIVGKWSKEQEERYYGRGKFMSGDTRPLVQLVRNYFGEGLEEMITNDYFIDVMGTDASDDSAQMEEKLLQLHHLFYNRFVAVVFLCFNPQSDSFFAVLELLWLLSFLLNWMEDKDADTIIKMMLQKIEEVKEFISASKKMIDDVMDIFDNYIASQKIELDGIEHEKLMTAMLFRQFQKVEKK